MSENGLNTMLAQDGLSGIRDAAGQLEGVLRVQDKDMRVFVHELGDESLAIVDDGLRDRLLDAVPCYLGGPRLYDDPVSLEVETGVDAGRVVIRRVRSGRLEREGETFTF